MGGRRCLEGGTPPSPQSSGLWVIRARWPSTLDFTSLDCLVQDRSLDR